LINEIYYLILDMAGVYGDCGGALVSEE